MAGVVGQGREQAEQEASTGESLRSLGWPQSKLLQCHHSRPHPWSLVGRQEALDSQTAPLKVAGAVVGSSGTTLQRRCWSCPRPGTLPSRSPGGSLAPGLEAAPGENSFLKGSPESSKAAEACCWDCCSSPPQRRYWTRSGFCVDSEGQGKECLPCCVQG